MFLPYATSEEREGDSPFEDTDAKVAKEEVRRCPLDDKGDPAAAPRTTRNPRSYRP